MDTKAVHNSIFNTTVLTRAHSIKDFKHYVVVGVWETFSEETGNMGENQCLRKNTAYKNYMYVHV